MQQLLLGALERLVRLAQLVVGALESLPSAGRRRHVPTRRPLRVEARRAVEVHRHRLAQGVAQLQLHHLAAALADWRSVEHGACAARWPRRPAASKRRAAQRVVAAAHQLAQRGVGLLDLARSLQATSTSLIADSRLKMNCCDCSSSAFFSSSATSSADQLGVHLVHLLDHVQPGGLVHAFDFGVGGFRAFGHRGRQGAASAAHGSADGVRPANPSHRARGQKRALRVRRRLRGSTGWKWRSSAPPAASPRRREV
jgi:hypothetical protein